MLFTINELLIFIENFPLDYINYFEAIVYLDGKIELAIPSHSETLRRFFMEKENISTIDELKNLIPIHYDPISYIVDKYKCVSVWYNYIIHSVTGLSDKQKEVNSILQNKGIISKFVKYHETDEYGHYLKYYLGN